MQCSSLSKHYVRQVSPYLVSNARLPVRRQAAWVRWFFRLISQEMTQRGFSICCVVCQPEMNIGQILLDGLKCHSNLTSITNFIQWFKETCCLQNIWKLIFFIVLSFLLCVYLCVHRHKFWNSVTHQFWWCLTTLSCYLLFQSGLLFPQKQLVFFLKPLGRCFKAGDPENSFNLTYVYYQGNSEMSAQK